MADAFSLHNEYVMEKITERDWQFYYRVDCYLRRIARFLISVPKEKMPFGNCHVISIAVSRIEPELKVEHGYLLGLSREADGTMMLQPKQHSWLVTPDGNIIDPYPVCIATKGIIMVCAVGDEACWGGAGCITPATRFEIGSSPRGFGGDAQKFVARSFVERNRRTSANITDSLPKILSATWEGRSLFFHFSLMLLFVCCGYRLAFV